MIKRKRYLHRGIEYIFRWNDRNHEKLKISSDNSTLIKLWNFFERVKKGDIPNNLFNDYSVPRVSQFKLTNIHPKFINSLRTKLIRQGKIKVLKDDSKYSKMAQVAENNLKGVNIKTNHENILNNILINDPESLAIEVPIWNRGQYGPLTGHIDLIQANGDTIKVIDYKPEKRFLRSLPQVAMYGFLLKKLFRVAKLRCVSFNSREAWEYDPEILMTDLKEFLNSHGIKEIEWEKFLL